MCLELRDALDELGQQSMIKVCMPARVSLTVKVFVWTVSYSLYGTFKQVSLGMRNRNGLCGNHRSRVRSPFATTTSKRTRREKLSKFDVYQAADALIFIVTMLIHAFMQQFRMNMPHFRITSACYPEDRVNTLDGY